jgi:hypothetical protein
VVNDGKKSNPLTTQFMRCLVCHFVYKTCNASNTTKKWKGTISYNQQHGTTFMKKHILAKHPIVWCRWKIINLSFVMEKQQWEFFFKRSIVGYEAITYYFQLSTPYKKDDA